MTVATISTLEYSFVVEFQKYLMNYTCGCEAMIANCVPSSFTVMALYNSIHPSVEIMDLN